MRVRRFYGRKAVGLTLWAGFRHSLAEIDLWHRPGEKEHHRLAVICPKKVVAKAVKRNKVKRVFFESTALILRGIFCPLDVVIVIRKGIDLRGPRRKEVFAMIEQSLSKTIKNLSQK